MKIDKLFLYFADAPPLQKNLNKNNKHVNNDKMNKKLSQYIINFNLLCMYKMINNVLWHTVKTIEDLISVYNIQIQHFGYILYKNNSIATFHSS